MRKFLLTTLMIATIGGSYFAQDDNKTVAEKREEQKHLGIREGETLEYCGTHWKMQQMMEKHPAMKLMYEKMQNQLDQDYKSFKEDPDSKPEAKAGVVYRIPLVFHVLHQNGVENISYDQIVDAVDILNRDYRLLNSDAGSVHANFLGMPADAEIEFALATIAPDGSCFNGVTRTYSHLAFDGSDGGDQIQAIVDGNDVVKGKPNPEVFLKAADKLKVAPNDCIVFEDAVAGIQAANAANMISIGIGDKEVLHEADFVFNDFTEISLDFIKKIIEE